MSDLVLLSVAGAELPLTTHHATCTIVEGRHASGRRTLSVSAAGWYPPALDSVAWSTTPITIGWRDLGASTPTWKSLSVWSRGPQITSDLVAPGASWTLEGVEAAGLSALVSVGGTSYWGRISVSPVGGVMQRKSSGAGVLLRAYAKRRVQIAGEGASAPAVSGLVAISGTLYSGNILCSGVAAALDPATGLVSWTIDGEEP